MASAGMRTVPVGPFDVAVGNRRAIISKIAELIELPGVRKAYALHVGGLGHRQDPVVAQAYGEGDIVYADGASVVVAARLVDGSRIDRSPTTDIGIPVLKAVRRLLGRTIRVCLVGGENGLAQKAGDVLAEFVDVEVVAALSGFSNDWERSLACIDSSRPDVVIVGMGAPVEMLWISQHEDVLPEALYLTCGGWFNFLTGRERRAPVAFQQRGLEWVYRVLQDPRGKASRYGLGIWHMSMCVLHGRKRRSGSP